MKKLTMISLICLGTFFFGNTVVCAQEESLTGSGKIQFEGQQAIVVYDPERPNEVADPGSSPTTNGNLRFDFVPQINFGRNAISNEDQVYQANAQLFHGNTGARGNFVQISDLRGDAQGWQLQVRQETQFRNEATTNKELKGAVISFDKSWTNSPNGSSLGPLVSKEVIRIDNIGETYNLAEAKPGTGAGTWSISFGASIDNDQNQANTLSPRVDADGNPLLDETFDNKPIYKNEAVTLAVPGITLVDPVQYQTVLTWILAELP